MKVIGLEWLQYKRAVNDQLHTTTISSSLYYSNALFEALSLTGFFNVAR